MTMKTRVRFVAVCALVAVGMGLYAGYWVTRLGTEDGADRASVPIGGVADAADQVHRTDNQTTPGHAGDATQLSKLESCSVASAGYVDSLSPEARDDMRRYHAQDPTRMAKESLERFEQSGQALRDLVWSPNEGLGYAQFISPDDSIGRAVSEASVAGAATVIGIDLGYPWTILRLRMDTATKGAVDEDVVTVLVQWFVVYHPQYPPECHFLLEFWDVLPPVFEGDRVFALLVKPSTTSADFVVPRADAEPMGSSGLNPVDAQGIVHSPYLKALDDVPLADAIRQSREAAY